jgi:hypothetical protein
MPTWLSQWNCLSFNYIHGFFQCMGAPFPFSVDRIGYVDFLLFCYFFFVIEKMVGHFPFLVRVGHPIHFASYKTHSTTSWFRACKPNLQQVGFVWFSLTSGPNLNLLYLDQLWRKCERSMYVWNAYASSCLELVINA